MDREQQKRIAWRVIIAVGVICGVIGMCRYWYIQGRTDGILEIRNLITTPASIAHLETNDVIRQQHADELEYWKKHPPPTNWDYVK